MRTLEARVVSGETLHERRGETRAEIGVGGVKISEQEGVGALVEEALKQRVGVALRRVLCEQVSHEQRVLLVVRARRSECAHEAHAVGRVARVALVQREQQSREPVTRAEIVVVRELRHIEVQDKVARGERLEALHLQEMRHELGAHREQPEALHERAHGRRVVHEQLTNGVEHGDRQRGRTGQHERRAPQQRQMRDHV